MIEPLPRKIRSYVRREGCMTRAQHTALAQLGARYLVEAQGVLDLGALFGRTAPRVLEIGFGMGDALAAMAQAHPEWDFLGIEVHRPGVGSLLLRIDKAAVGNVRLVCADAVEVLQRHLPEACLDAVHLYFPDPWPKSRHHKRRIVQPAFVELVRQRLKIGGRFHLATDWEDYARHMLQVLGAARGFANAVGGGCYSARPADRPLTKFEQRGRRLGHGVWDLVFVREA